MRIIFISLNHRKRNNQSQRRSDIKNRVKLLLTFSHRHVRLKGKAVFLETRHNFGGKSWERIELIAGEMIIVGKNYFAEGQERQGDTEVILASQAVSRVFKTP